MKGSLKRLERGEGTALLTLEVQCSAEEASELRRQLAAGLVELELGLPGADQNPADELDLSADQDNEEPSDEDGEKEE